MKTKYIGLLLVLLLITINSYAIKPDTTYISTPKKYGINYFEKRIHTVDSVCINTWVFIPKTKDDKKTTIILSYGDAGNMSYFIGLANNLCKKGYKVITYDYRGFGKSEKFNTVNNQLFYKEFVDDLSAVILFSKKLDNNRLGLLGLSMGSIISVLAIDFNIEFLILEGVISDLKPFVKNINIKYNKELLLPPIHVLYDQKIREVRIPMLIYSGTNDMNTPIQNAKKVCSFKKNRKLVIYNGSHLQGSIVMREQYFNIIEDFVLSKP